MSFDPVENCYNYIKFVPPGVHSYYFATEKEIGKNKFTNEQTIIVKPRDEEINLQVKYQYEEISDRRFFDKNTSVFKDFKADSVHSLKKAFEVDWKYCKYDRIITNRKE